MRQIKPKLKEGTKIDKAKIFVCTLYVCVTIRSSGCPIMWFRIAENGSVNGDATASPFTKPLLAILNHIVGHWELLIVTQT